MPLSLQSQIDTFKAALVVLPWRTKVSLGKQGWSAGQCGESTGVLFEAATVVCQAPLFLATMVSHVDFSAASIFKLAANMYEPDSSTSLSAMETILEPVGADGVTQGEVENLVATTTRVKTMPTRLAIERSSIAPGVVVLDNSLGIF